MRSLKSWSSAAWLGCCLLLVPSCELVTEPFPRALEGRYDAVWTYSPLDSRGVPVFPSRTCAGAIRIEEASESALIGSYTIPASEGCIVSSGELSGLVRSDGGLTLFAESIDLRFGACALDGVQISLNGVAERRRFEVQGRTQASCPDVTSSVRSLQIFVAADRR